MRISVTGASGFIGQAVISDLISYDHEVIAVVRSQSKNVQSLAKTTKTFAIGNIGTHSDWSDALSGVDCVIHCAARAHVMNETKANALAAYRAVNVEGTRNLAERAAASGVKRFIYLSSIKVNGEQTDEGAPFTCDENVNPQDPYGLSKWEAEKALHEVAGHGDLEVVIIRPPLVYGPGVKGNFRSMLGWLRRGIPLPVGSIYNKRSFVGIDNLSDLIVTCIDHPAAANQAFLVSDNEDLSTTELLHRMGKALGKPAHLVPVPARFLQLGAQMLGKNDIAQRLLGNLQVDISKTKELLGWTPRISVDEGFQKTAEWHMQQR